MIIPVRGVEVWVTHDRRRPWARPHEHQRWELWQPRALRASASEPWVM